MSPGDHYEKAEELLARASLMESSNGLDRLRGLILAEAQVHATLATASHRPRLDPVSMGYHPVGRGDLRTGPPDG